MRFFFDRNMSPYLARAIDILDRENEVRHHDQDPRFNERTTDIEWVSVLGKDVPTWVVLSGDGAILKNRAELKALKEAKLTYFCMSNRWSKMKTSEYAWRLIKIWPDIVEKAKRAYLRPQIFEVSGGKSNKIDLITF
jgi:PIN like domain